MNPSFAILPHGGRRSKRGPRTIRGGGIRPDAEVPRRGTQGERRCQLGLTQKGAAEAAGMDVRRWQKPGR